MKEKGKVLFIVLIFSGILVLLGLLLFRRSGQDSFTTKNEESKAVNGMDLVTDSRFIEYTPDVIESNKDKRRILYFYANWCPICRPADAEFKANQGRIPEGVVVIRINYNASSFNICFLRRIGNNPISLYLADFASCLVEFFNRW